MNKKNLFLIIWIGCFVMTLIFSLIFNLVEEGSGGYTVMALLVVASLAAGIIFVFNWKKICPECKDGKLVYVRDEEGESFTKTLEEKSGTSTIKNKSGEVIKTVEKTAVNDYLITPIYKVYICDNCGYEHKKLKNDIKKEKLS